MVLILKEKEKVRLCQNTTVQARTERILYVRCKRSLTSVTVDFEHNSGSNASINGLFISRTRVVPNRNGVFQIAVFNVMETDIVLYGRILIGNVWRAEEICRIEIEENPH